MSDTVKSWIETHEGGKLTVEDINLAVHGEHRVASDYYSATLEKSGRISVRTKWAAPVGAIAQLAYAKGLSVTMEFDSIDNSEIGSMQLYYRREALEAMDEIGVLDYYRPGAVPQDVRDADARYARKKD
jgi:hypothetical protein